MYTVPVLQCGTIKTINLQIETIFAQPITLEEFSDTYSHHYHWLVKLLVGHVKLLVGKAGAFLLATDRLVIRCINCVS